MKKIYTLLAILAMVVSSIQLFAQAPEAFRYQAVIRGTDGLPMKSQALNLRLSILQGSETGTAVYTETHAVTTSDIGLVNLEIGKGASMDQLSDVNWSAGPFFLLLSLPPRVVLPLPCWEHPPCYPSPMPCLPPTAPRGLKDRLALRDLREYRGWQDQKASRDPRGLKDPRDQKATRVNRVLQDPKDL
ncbi:MAG: hypothetical protein U0T82_00030 [Bacteroidales bacterium]